MCGIAGIYHYGDDRDVDENVLTRMRDTLVHRGPDGAGTWISPDRRIGFAHRRLSIIDPRPAAAQPMSNEDGLVWVTFNGEIYNHLALRKQLLERGHRFRTDHSDTEVLVHGFEEWGIDGLLARLKGMFAFALFDCRSRDLYLVRDRLGIKPLYFSFHGGTLLFASEIKALLRYPGLSVAMSGTALYHYLSFLTTPAPLTMYKGVYKIPAGHLLRISSTGNTDSRRYWDALPGSGIAREDLAGLSEGAMERFYIDGIRSRLERSVEEHMMSDVPYGAFLSGGIDSTTNVALMSRFTDKPVKTFTIGFKDHTHLNELGYARMAADHFGTEHHEVLIGERDMVGYLDQMVYHQDEPIADWVCVPLYFVSRLARDNGVKVVQVGEGADEQFAGYESYLDFEFAQRYIYQPFHRFCPALLRKPIVGIAQALASFNPGWAGKADLVERAAYGRETFWTGATLFWETQKRLLLNAGQFPEERFPRELVDSGLLPPGHACLDSFEVIREFRNSIEANHGAPPDYLTRMIYNEFKLRLPELLLMRVDKITMSTSLEARVPFLDHEFVQFTMDIGRHWKVERGTPKSLLRKAVRGWIPDAIIDRPKVGFGAPMKEWLGGRFGEEVAARFKSSKLNHLNVFNSQFIDSMFSKQQMSANAPHVWALYNLALWYESNIESSN